MIFSEKLAARSFNLQAGLSLSCGAIVDNGRSLNRVVVASFSRRIEQLPHSSLIERRNSKML